MYSQYGEDEYVQNTYFPEKKTGIYLELGAMDGLKYSNTLLFSQIGWTGILIEANPIMAMKLCENRPNDRSFNYAITPTTGTTEFSVANHEACGAVNQIINDEMRKKRHLTCEKIEVACCPLRNIVDSKSYPKIDFWSLDVEGSELECLESFDWTIQVDVIMVEMLSLYEDKNKHCRELLESKGYIKDDKDLFLSEFWIKKINVSKL